VPDMLNQKTTGIIIELLSCLLTSKLFAHCCEARGRR
jgi:hypothetical protein